MYQYASKSKAQSEGLKFSTSTANKNHSKTGIKTPMQLMPKMPSAPLQMQLRTQQENSEAHPLPMIRSEEQARLAPRSTQSNNTGIPLQMKEKFENLSGFSFDDVRVHYNSNKPTQLQALAYTQGNQVYIGPGQEKHLGHELGHVVQQKEGRVQPNKLINGMMINDNPDLEKQASEPIRPNAHTIQSCQTKTVIQKMDTFIPDATEPHLHIHSGGVTFTNIGHRHKNLVSGNQVRRAAVREVRHTLEGMTHANVAAIINYINTTIEHKMRQEDQEHRGLSEIDELKEMLREMGAYTEDLENPINDNAFEEAVENICPQNVSHRDAGEYAPDHPYIGNAFLRNAIYIRRVYEQYYNFRCEQEGQKMDDEELSDGQAVGKNSRVHFG